MVGSNIRPWDVPMRKLTTVMDAVQRLIEQKDKYVEESEDTNTGEISPLQLLDIKKGSAAYKVASEDRDRSLDILQRTGREIYKPQAAEWTSSSLSAISDLSDVARSLGCEIEFRLPGGKGKLYGDVLATIRPDTYSVVSAQAFVTGETSVYGKIERVGGASNMHCGLHVPNQSRMIICKVVGADLIRELGQFIYQHVVVSGTATWVRRGSFLRSLTIKSYDPPKTGSIASALEAAHKAGGSAWDEIGNPSDYIAGMR